MRGWLFSFWNRYIAPWRILFVVIPAALSILGSAFSIIAYFDRESIVARWLFDNNHKIMDILHWAVVALLILTIIASLLNYFILRNSTRKSAKFLHNIFHYGRNHSVAAINELMPIINSGSFVHNPENINIITSIRHQIVTHLRQVVDDTKRVFDAITNEPCAVTIKWVDPPPNSNGAITNNTDLHDLYVTEFMRDSDSQRERTMNIDRSYRAVKNTAYMYILEKKDVNYGFISNDLKNNKPEFNNPREDWGGYYNACLVVPIQSINIKNGNVERTVVGFLSVDNMYGGFDERYSYHILCCIADYVYVHLFLCWKINKLLGETHPPKV